MPTLAIVDDRKEHRETMSRVVTSTLKRLKQDREWNVVSAEPPQRERDVVHWLDENDATVLISDWKLNEGAKSKRTVNYEADRLIDEIRTRRPTFPIYVVTGFESQARTHLKDVENIFTREYFTSHIEVILSQVLRAGLRRYTEQRDLLRRMDSLSHRVAAGKASPKQKVELKSLQGYFQAEVPTILNLDEVLKEFEVAQENAQALRKRVQRRIDQRSRAK